MGSASRAIVTVQGIDRKGIIASVSRVLYENDVNILDITQTVLSGLFNMVMVVDVSGPKCSFFELGDALELVGQQLGMQIRLQRSEIFEAMHQI